MNITVGYKIQKPVETQEQCDLYAAAAEAVNTHNTAAGTGEMLWMIEELPDCYTVAESGANLPAAEPEPTLQEQITALQSAQTDTDSLMVDQEYRLTLMELGIVE